MNKKNFFIKILYSLTLLSLVFWQGVGIAQAELFSSDIPSASEILDEVETRYGYDPDILRRTKKKGSYPEVELFFDKTAPQKGEKVTATAMPKYFKNSNNDLYYTWFLFRDGDSLDSTQVMEKAKRRAMGIVARGDFDPFLFGSNYLGGSSDPDDDGYEASYGGDDGEGGRESTPTTNFGIGRYESDFYTSAKEVVASNRISRCYRHNFGYGGYGTDSGEDLIVECEHKFAEANSSSSFLNPADGTLINCGNGHDVGDGEFGNNEEACWKLDPTNPDTDGDGINDEADVAGLAQSQFVWTFEPGDRVGVIIEGTSTIVINESDRNAYYKIAWAGIDVCDEEEVEGEDKEDLIESDECENDDDYGFTYMATRSAFEKQEELLKSNLIFSPQSPQFNVENNEYSDLITVTSNLLQSGANDEFVYYDWDVYYCDAGSLDTCTSVAANNLTIACGRNDVLGDCANDLISNSFAEGIGKSEIRFKLSDNFISSRGARDSFYLKVFLRTKKSANDSIVGVSSVDIPIAVDDNKIRFFRTSEQSNGNYGFSGSGDEVCVSGVYDRICPVFPGQILGVVADIDIDGSGGSQVESYSWYLNDIPLDSPFTSSGSCFFSGGCDLGSTAYVPISGSSQELQKISLKVKKTGGEEITSERIISVEKPLALINSNNSSSAWPWVVDDGSASGVVSEDVFVGRIGSTLSFSANLIPDYLNGRLSENNMSLVWYVNGQEVDSDFISANSGYGVSLSGQEISFNLAGEEGDSLGLRVEVVKDFSTTEETIFQESWGIRNPDELRSEKAIVIRKTAGSSLGTLAEASSLERFTASTLNNAPEYLVFIIRTAIVLVLFWSFVVGFNYWFRRENNIIQRNG